MINFRTLPLCAAVICTGLASPALAQTTTLVGDHVIQGDLFITNGNAIGNLYVENNSILDGRVCMGNSCSIAETFANSEILRFKDPALSLQFVDNSSMAAPNRDWTLRVNDEASFATGGIERFSIEDDTAGTTPFTIAGGVPTNTLWLASNGRVGLGTSIPQASLDIVGSTPAVRMQQTGTTNNWTLSAGSQFTINDNSAASVPVIFEPGAPTDSLRLKANGYVGLGTSSPGAPLTVSTPDTFSFFRIEALGAPVNTSADMTFTAGPTNNGEYRINVVDGDGPEMRVNAEGYVIATTGFRVGSTDLTVPDYVFEPNYALRPLAEVQAFIETNKHLPDVPSAAKIAADGLDMTQMQMTLLKKVEELTLYTLELEAARAAQDDRIARLEALLITPEHPIAE